MEFLARLGVAAAELFEAEGRSLRRNLIRLAAAIGFGIVLLVLALGGLFFILFGIYRAFEQLNWNSAEAALATGLLAFAFVGLGAFLIRQMF